MSTLRTAFLFPLAASAVLTLAISTVLALGPAPSRAEGDAPEPAPAAEAPPATRASTLDEASSCLGKARLRGAIFEHDSATLVPAALPMLDVVATAMKGPCAGKTILIEGHTHASGNAETDRSISEARAVAVKAQLVARGVPEAQLRTQGLGASRPLTHDPELAELNRRVSFVVESE